MKDVKMSFLIQSIQNDIALLKNKHIYELDRVPGNPSCNTLGTRLENNFIQIVEYMENTERKLNE